MAGAEQLSSKNTNIPGPFGQRKFILACVYIVLLGFVMAVPAQAEDCADVPDQPGARAEPDMCAFARTSGGITVTLTYTNDLTVDYVHSDDPMYPEPADNPNNDPATPNPSTPGGYNPGAYTCLHYYKDGNLLKEVSHKPHEENGARLSGNQLTFEYEHPEGIECEEGEELTVKFEMYNGNPYIDMNDTVVSHIGYELNAGSDEQYQITLGTLTCPIVTTGGGNGGGGGGNGGGGGGNGGGNGNGNGDNGGEGSEGDGQQRSGSSGYLENPAPGSFQSGIGVISGWVCDAQEVEIIIGDMAPQPAAYGTERLDTAEACGDTDNGFGMLFNWNRLEDGEHTVRALVDGVELGRATFTVTTLDEEFVREATGEAEVIDFPEEGRDVRLLWQEGLQNFMIAPLVQGREGQ